MIIITKKNYPGHRSYHTAMTRIGYVLLRRFWTKKYNRQKKYRPYDLYIKNGYKVAIEGG